MAFDNIVSRADAQSLIPLPVAQEIQKAVIEESAALRLFKTVPMSSKTERMPVISALPVAAWVTGDTGLKETTEANWADKTLVVEELACIVPIPDAVIADAAFDIWGEIRPLIAEAMARALDSAVFFGTNKPPSWPADVVAMAVAAGNVVSVGANTTAKGGTAEDINATMATVEADGYDVNGFVTSRAFRSKLRGARDVNGQRYLDIDANGDRVEGQPVAYAMRGLWPNPAALGSAQLIAGDFTKGIIGVRQDITYKLFTEGVIQNGTGAIIYNLLQQDMSAMRVVARYAYQVANPINYSNNTETSRAPFGVLRTAPV